MKDVTGFIEDVYAGWLVKKNDKNREKYREHKGVFSASSAGSCFRKQYLKSKNLAEPPLDKRVMRLLRLGTIVHEDIQTSLKHYFRNTDTKLKLYIEHQIRIPELNVIGHLDAALYDSEEESIKLYDIKTSASYKWRMKFGRKKEKNGSINYNLQLGTYAFGLGEELKTTNVDMSILWYNKDTSAFREERIPQEWIGSAVEYWEEVNETLDGVTSDNGAELIPGSYGVPMMNWECRYCGFKDIHCQGI
tara:strand:+ start:2233 stop:2976 length:744 start_codon:yes stop_codon:yes gene_type:complete